MPDTIAGVENLLEAGVNRLLCVAGDFDKWREGLVIVAHSIEESRPLVVVVGEELLDYAIVT